MNIFFPNSSTVEHLAVNEAVLGSNPSLGADRGVAQPGSALALGARCRRFESCYPDHFLGAMAEWSKALAC